MPKAALLHAWGPNMQAASAIFLLISAIVFPVFIRSAFVGGLEGFTTFHARVASSFFALSEPAAPSGSRQAATICSVYARTCTSHHGGSTILNVTGSPPRLPFSPRRHCSSFPCAATALLFIVPPVETSRVERQMVKRWAVLPMMVLGLGFELGTQAQAYEEKPTFMKALIALGLPIDILWAWA